MFACVVKNVYLLYLIDHLGYKIDVISLYSMTGNCVNILKEEKECTAFFVAEKKEI